MTEDKARTYSGLFGEELRVFADDHHPGPCTARKMDAADEAHMRAVLEERRRARETDRGRPVARITREATE